MKGISKMLMVVLGKDAVEDDTPDYYSATPDYYSAEEVGTRRSRRERREEGRQPQDLTIESAAAIIDVLPSDIPWESALRIVRGTLRGAGIDVSNLERFTRARASKLGSEIELARKRQKEFRQKTEETVRSLEEEIRKAQEACDTILVEEERKISRALATLEEVRRVRAFFDFPETEEEENTIPSVQDTQPLGEVRTQVGRRSGRPAQTGL